MGFSLTGTHVIFFIASVIIAGAVSGIFVAITYDVSNSLSSRGERVQDQLDIEFKIFSLILDFHKMDKNKQLFFHKDFFLLPIM